MAFVLSKFGRGTMSFNIDGPTWHMYNSGADDNAAVVAVSYFDAVADLLKANDVIYVVTDANTLINTLQVVSIVAGVVTTSAFDTVVGAGAIGTANIADDAVTKAKLATGVEPSHVVKYASQLTTVGGAAAEAFAVAGIAATDLAFVQIVADGTGNVTVLQAVCTLNTLTVTFSADPVADTVFNYQILRAAV